MKYGFGVTPVFRETYKSYKIWSDSTNTYENYEWERIDILFY